MMKNWFKKSFYEFANNINKDLLVSLINSSFDDLYDDLYKKKISEIPDYELLSVFERNSYEKNFKYSLNYEKQTIIKNMDIIIENNIKNKYIIASNFIIEYLSKEYFGLISKKLKEKAEIMIQNRKDNLDLFAKETAKDIYVNIVKDIDLNLIIE